jgi:hypothetical protein
MGRFLIVFVSLMLAGCESLPDWSAFTRAAGSAAPSRYSFDWALSGSQAVSPVQVFDDGRRTWLQFAEQATIPAIFSRSARGDVPLTYHRDGPYVVLPGVWPSLVLRGGRLEGFVQRAAPADGAEELPQSRVVSSQDGQPSYGFHADEKAVPALAGTTRDELRPVPLASPVGATKASARRAPAGRRQPTVSDSVRAAAPSAVASVAPAETAPASAGTGSAAQVMPVPSDAAPVPAPAAPAPREAMAVAAALGHGVTRDPPKEAFEISPADRNIRRALGRWAKIAGWTFDVEHWAVDVDVPVVGTARFDAGFKSSVQALLAATELGDRPLRPCFYANKVVRVVPYAQVCDRTRDPARVS